MKKSILLLPVIGWLFLMPANTSKAQVSMLDTLMFSPSLNMNKNVRVVFPLEYQQNTDKYYPVVYYLHGWMGNHTSGTVHINYMYSYIASGTIQPFIMVIPNSYCSPFEGSMYMNSSLWGNYQDYVSTDLVAWVDSTFRTVPQKSHRGLLGQSMGSYGCLFLPIAHPDLYRAAAGHAGGGSYYHYDSLCKALINNSFAGNPPYFYNYGNTQQLYVRGFFLLAGGCSPNPNTTQTYINPQVVDYPFDAYANIIDSTWNKIHTQSAEMNIQQLSPSDSVSFLLSCGTADEFYQFEPMKDLVDTMLANGLDIQWLPHTGGHNPPGIFNSRSLIFLDSLLGDPVILTGQPKPEPYKQPVTEVFPNPGHDLVQISINLKEDAALEIRLIDMSSRIIEVMNTESLPVGQHLIPINIAHVLPGYYLVEIRTGRWTTSHKILIR